jgi:hypothetical protein
MATLVATALSHLKALTLSGQSKLSKNVAQASGSRKSHMYILEMPFKSQSSSEQHRYKS